MVQLWHGMLAQRLPVGTVRVHCLGEAANRRFQIAFLLFVAGLTLILSVLFGVGWPAPTSDTLEITGLEVEHQGHRRLRRASLVVGVAVHRRSILTVVALVVVAIWRLKSLFGSTFTIIAFVDCRVLRLSRAASHLVDEKVLGFLILALFEILFLRSFHPASVVVRGPHHAAAAVQPRRGHRGLGLVGEGCCLALPRRRRLTPLQRGDRRGLRRRFDVVERVDEILSGIVLRVEEVAAEVVREFFTVGLTQFEEGGLLFLFEAAILQPRIEVASLSDRLSDQLFAEEFLRCETLQLERFFSEQAPRDNLVVGGLDGDGPLC